MELVLPNSAGGTRWFTDSGHLVRYGGNVYMPSNDFLSATPPDKRKPRSLMQLVMNDKNAVWSKRFDLAGNDAPITLRAVLVNENVNEALATFPGVVDDYKSGRQPNGTPILLVGATLLFLKLDDQPRNSTSKSFQRDFATAMGTAPDTSMDGSHLAFRAVRHKAAS